MKQFKINEKISVICESKKTRNGFKHEATLLLNGEECDTAKCCYLNRTWEAYEYQSVLYKLFEKTQSISEEEKETCKLFAKNGKEDLSGLKSILAVAQLGDIFCNSKKEKNDWKLRMLKAGLEDKGLSIPKDWDTLSEEEKESRLNKVVGVLRE